MVSQATEVSRGHASVRRVALALLGDDYDRRLVASRNWDDFSDGTQRSYLTRACYLAAIYRNANAVGRTTALAAALLRHEFEHNRASSAEWDDLITATQEWYLFRAQQLTREIAY